MVKKKLYILLTIIAFLSLALGSFVWANTQNNGQSGNNSAKGPFAQAITLQDQEAFIEKKQSNEISNNHLVNTETEIWAFGTNGGQVQLKNAYSDIDLSLYLLNSQGEQVGDPYHITIKEGQSSGSTKIVFPTAGQYQLRASGSITVRNGNEDESGNGSESGNNGNDKVKTENVEYTTNLFWVGPHMTADHFGFVDSSGSAITNPSLNLRADVDSPNSSWAYIGEPMHINVSLKAYNEEGIPMDDYVWDVLWFTHPEHWNIVSSEGSISSSILSVSAKDSILSALIDVSVNDANLNQVIRDFSITVKPTDGLGISTLSATPALVSNQGSKYTLYEGRIRVAPGYFYQKNGNAYVYVEKYDDSQNSFVQNTADSQTSVDSWDLSGTPILTPDFEFQAGKGEVSLPSNDKSNLTKTLKPMSYPAYLGVVEGNLTWGQIVDNPPPQNPLQKDEGPVWERELAP